MKTSLWALLAIAAAAGAAPQDYRTTPVPILKQINRHNDDGSYSFGYEAADGTFKVETKYPTGEVVGKYGYIGDDGKVREVEYGASRRGFEPTGTGINVPPPTLVDESKSYSNFADDYDDGQYREDPSIYYRSSAAPSPQTYRPTAPTFGTHRFQSPSYQQQHQQQQQNYYRFSAPQRQYTPQYTAPRGIAGRGGFANSFFAYDPAPFRGHPAKFDLLTGSYSVSY